jgi:hypothetical protein
VILRPRNYSQEKGPVVVPAPPPSPARSPRHLAPDKTTTIRGLNFYINKHTKAGMDEGARKKGKEGPRWILKKETREKKNDAP